MKSFLKSTAGAVGGGLMAAGAITGAAVAGVTGATPLIAGAVGIGVGAKKGAAWGKSIFAKTGDADKAIDGAAKVSEKETVGGLNIKVLNSIYKEVVGIRSILGKSDPASEEREKALDARTRHKEILAAFGGGMLALPAPKEEKKDMSKWMALLPLAGLLGALGLSKLPEILEKFPEYMEAIGDAIDNIQEFLADVDSFFSKIGMDFFGASALVAGIKGGAKRGPKLRRGVNRTFRRGEYKTKPKGSTGKTRTKTGWRPQSPKPKPKPTGYRRPQSPKPKPKPKPTVYKGGGKGIGRGEGQLRGPYKSPWGKISPRLNEPTGQRYTGRNPFGRPYSAPTMKGHYSGGNPFKIGFDKMGSGVRAPPYAGAGQRKLPTRAGSINPYMLPQLGTGTDRAGRVRKLPAPYKSFTGRNLVNRLGQEKLPGRPWTGGGKGIGHREGQIKGTGRFIDRYGLPKPRTGEVKAPKLGFRPTAPRITSGVSMRGVTSPRINPYALGYQGRTGLPPGQDWLAGRRLLSGGQGIGQTEGRLQGLRYGGVNPFAGRPYPAMGSGVRALPYAGAGQKALPTRTGSIKPYVPPRLGTMFQGETRPTQQLSRGATSGAMNLAQQMLENLSADTLDAELKNKKTGDTDVKNKTGRRMRLRGGFTFKLTGAQGGVSTTKSLGQQLRLPKPGLGSTATPPYAKPVAIKTGDAGSPSSKGATMADVGRPTGNPRGWTKEVLHAFYPGWNNVIKRWTINNPWTAHILGGAAKSGLVAFQLYWLYNDLKTLLGAWWNAEPKTDRWPFGDDPADLALRAGLLQLSAAYGSAYFGAMAGGIMASGLLPPIGTVLGAIGGGVLGYVGGNALMNFLLSPPMEEGEYHPSDYAEDAYRFAEGGRYSGMGLLRNKDRSFATKHPGAALGHTIKPGSRFYEAGQAAVIYAGGPQYDNVNIFQLTNTDASSHSVARSIDTTNVVSGDMSYTKSRSPLANRFNRF